MVMFCVYQEVKKESEFTIRNICTNYLSKTEFKPDHGTVPSLSHESCVIIMEQLRLLTSMGE